MILSPPATIHQLDSDNQVQPTLVSDRTNFDERTAIIRKNKTIKNQDVI
ncbi:MAG: hypothetical protein QNJ64_03070 [Crocosphaera sp.]|nr:hypothetical protein [Crocosphaera sp.]